MLALAAVHAAKVVHRDIKPANILLSRDGPKLIDFGIAHTGDNTVLTTTGLAIGSPAWMAPEQVEAKVVGTAADVFCAGSVLLFAATGRPPWGSGSIAEVMGQIAVAEPDLSGLTAWQQQWLRGLLEKDPGRRPGAAQAAQLLTDTTWDEATQVVLARWGGAGTKNLDGGKYSGDLTNGISKGQGTWTSQDGDKYTGEFKDDLFNGQGTYTWANGDKYTGEFKVGYFNGQGIKTFANGDRYAGQFKADKFNGQGTLVLSNGSIIAGLWKDGVAIRKGGIANKQLFWLVVGIALVLGGYGTYTYTNFFLNGYGTRTFADGGKYSGEFEDGKADGQGTYTWPNGTTYIGEFKAGKCNGQGTKSFINGDKYSGGWVDDKRNGQGIMTFANGAKYSGGWMDDMINGQGTYTWPNGAKYRGGFRDGKAMGEGTITYANGNTDHLFWSDGQPVGPQFSP